MAWLPTRPGGERRIASRPGSKLPLQYGIGLSNLRVLIVLAAFPALLSGQFRNLSTTDDGNLLLFSSSLRQTGSSEAAWAKLFSIDAGGLKLYAERQPETPPPGVRVSNYYLMQDAELSGDGSVRAVISGRICVIPGSGCFLGYSFTQSEVSGVPGKYLLTFPGQIRLSRNGRYALVCCDNFVTPTFVDLNTGAAQVLAGSIGTLTRGMVASTGAVVVPQRQNSLLVATLTATRELTTSANTTRAVVDDQALTAFYEGLDSDGNERLAQVDLRSGVERPLVRARNLTLVGTTNDGRAVAFLSDANLISDETAGVPQLFSVQADGSGLRQITHDPAGLVEATLARNGALAYAVTAAGRLLKIDLASGASTQLIGRTVTFESSGAGTAQTPVPGSAYCVQGTGFADAPVSVAPPLPASLNGLQLLLDGSPLPLQSVTPGQVCCHLPWNTPLGTHSLTLVTNADPQFQSLSTTSLSLNYSMLASFGFLEPEYPVSTSLAPYALAAHQDFSGLVTRASPARPGEILHFYMTGLGPVDPHVETGVAAPANPPAVITSPLSCQWTAVGNAIAPMPILFAGLAPGLAGYYQVSLRLPPQIPAFAGESLLVCSVGPDYRPATGWIPVVAESCAMRSLASESQIPQRCLDQHRAPLRPSVPN